MESFDFPIAFWMVRGSSVMLDAKVTQVLSKRSRAELFSIVHDQSLWDNMLG